MEAVVTITTVLDSGRQGQEFGSGIQTHRPNFCRLTVFYEENYRLKTYSISYLVSKQYSLKRHHAYNYTFHSDNLNYAMSAIF